MKEQRFLSLSVHDLVDFLLRQGDIDNRVYNAETMQMGTKIHASFQEKQGNEYLSEVPLKETFPRKLGTIALEGRADGIIVGGPFPIIDEIKSTVMDLEAFHAQQHAWHFGQAECYALMYLHQEKLDKCGIRLTYISQIDNTKKVVEGVYSLEQIEHDIGDLMDRYLAFYTILFQHDDARNASCAHLAFPYDKFRSGQREMAKYCYAIAKNGGTFYCEAPTGIGKTMSTLYPCLKAFPDTDNQKIFYLTAKSSGRESAYEALSRLYEKGLVARDSLLMAKEKVCFTPGAACNPDECPFAKDYYTKLPKIVLEALSSGQRFDPEYVGKLAKKYAVCPFELQLDLSLYSDVIICDYNYFFDPLVHLDRFFGPEADASHDLVLVDEAHNLIDRGRDMYSASLSAEACAWAKKSLRHWKNPGLKTAISKLEKALRAFDLASSDASTSFVEIPKSIQSALNGLSKQALSLNKKPHPKLSDDYKELSRECHRFDFLNQNYPAQTVIYGQREGTDYVLHLFCLDPSPMLADSLDLVKGRIIFSATLSPISYYMNAITGEDKSPYLLLPSPFPKENFELLLAPMVSTRYKDREKTYQEVADYLAAFVSGKIGNYFLYFPSYEYLENIRKYLHFPLANVYEQDRDMSDDEKGLFLSRFLSHPTKTSIGLLIIGGSFSEGIDLVEDRLIGVAVVGIGLPQICHERDLIREHFDKSNGQGFDYAYRNPGMNKVMQAVGRLIRSEKDVGAALLIDDRYMVNEYRDLFSRAWNGYEVVTSPQEAEDKLKVFFAPMRK
jgi:DNA excision repair protein ERCC-2